MIAAATMLFLLLVGHALADYPLQGDFIAQAKNRNTPAGKLFWRWVLPSHGLIHAGFVFAVTRSLTLAMIELVAHCVIDFAKCENRISFNQDQAWHVACKVAYVVAASAWVLP